MWGRRGTLVLVAQLALACSDSAKPPDASVGGDDGGGLGFCPTFLDLELSS
jgi:hypothetical protein